MTDKPWTPDDLRNMARDWVDPAVTLETFQGRYGDDVFGSFHDVATAFLGEIERKNALPDGVTIAPPEGWGGGVPSSLRVRQSLGGMVQEFVYVLQSSGPIQLDHVPSPAAPLPSDEEIRKAIERLESVGTIASCANVFRMVLPRIGVKL